MKKNQMTKMVISALLLAIGLVLPFLTGQIPQLGSMLLPLHLPVLICGFVCGWSWGLAVGFILPLFRSLLFGMPPMVPTALAMAFEMAAYGAISGLLYQKLEKKPTTVYVSLILAMLVGRIVWGLVSIPLYALFTDRTFAIATFWMGGFVNAWPGMVLQLVLVPVIVFALERAKIIPMKGDVQAQA
ncbi:MAG: ECF transporter S component [Eubacteriales bacterium]|nr:ECF transporter S component [Eubacteriales bacterium]